MKAGWLRERVEIQRRIQGKDAKGGNVTTWVKVGTVSAGIESLVGGVATASKAGGGEYAFGMYEVTIRYRPGLSREDMRLIWDGKALEIKDMRNPRNRNDSLVFTCKEGQRGNV